MAKSVIEANTFAVRFDSNLIANNSPPGMGVISEAV